MKLLCTISKRTQYSLSVLVLMVIYATYYSENIRHLVACLGLNHTGVCTLLPINIPYRSLWYAVAAGLGFYSYKIIKQPIIPHKKNHTIKAKTLAKKEKAKSGKKAQKKRTTPRNERSLSALRKLINPTDDENQ